MTISENNKSIGDTLANSLRTRILAGDFPVGHPLTELAVATEYQVARQTAKAAIERLVFEGILERTNYRSARVPVLGAERIRDLYFARVVVETGAYQLLAERHFVSAEAMQAHKDYCAAVSPRDVPRLIEADIAFHRALVKSLNSPRLERAYSLIINEMRLCLNQLPGLENIDPAIIAREHTQIIEAIKGGNKGVARRRGIDHLSNTESRLLASPPDQAAPRD